MGNQKKIRAILGGVIAGLTMLLGGSAMAAIVVIGNPNIKLSHLTKQDIKHIYLNKSVHLSTGEVLRPIDQLANSRDYRAFYQDLMGWTPNQVRVYRYSLSAHAQDGQPDKVAGDKDIIAAVEGTPDAIAYVDTQTFSKVDSNAKVLYRLTKTPVKPMHIRLLSKAVHHTAKANNLWPIMAAHFTLGKYVNRAEVRHQILWYVSHKAILEHILKNSTPYIYYIYRQTQLRHMPAEFALLPMVESGYNPFAYSSAGAAGLWQLMPSTASSFGLSIDWWYDARRDTVVSTEASLNYLVTLHDALHGWLLASAAYNAGIGSVRAAEEDNRRDSRPTDFWTLPLTSETRNYVPKLLALSEIIKHPSYYGVKLPYIANHPDFSGITINSQMDRSELARLAGTSSKVIQRLNPGMRRFATQPDGVYTLLLPYNKINSFKNHLSALNAKTHVTWQYHEVRRGETLENIAHNYHTNLTYLKRVNGLKSDRITASQGLLVPLYLHKTYNQPLLKSLPLYSANHLTRRVNHRTKTHQPANLKALLQRVYG